MRTYRPSTYPILIKTTETGTPLNFPVWVTKPRLLRVVVVVPVKSEARISLRPSLPTVMMLFATAVYQYIHTRGYARKRQVSISLVVRISRTGALRTSHHTCVPLMGKDEKSRNTKGWAHGLSK